MINVKNLVFDYPGTRALDDISFTIRKGSITALVGPNGAGKTTLLRCLAVLEEPVSGRLLMNDSDIFADPRAAHRVIGYLSDFFGLYEDLTARQCLRYAAMSHGIPDDRHEQVIGWCAEQLEIADRLEMKAGSLSRGQRQRLAIAQAIIHEPKFLLLDEPASGLDPEARHSLAALFRRLRDGGMTLLVSSHILSELEEYSTDLLVLRGGRIVEHTAIAESGQSAILEIRLISPYDGLRDVLANWEKVADLVVNDTRATFSFCSDPVEQNLLLKELLDRGVPVCFFAEQGRNLQEAYLKTVKSEGAQGGKK